MKKLYFLVLLTCTTTVLFSQKVSNPQVLNGQDTVNRIITTAVPFLGITPDSRAAGMGDVGAATSADANSAYWNSAKLAFIDQGYGGSASYTPWLGKIINDMSIFYLSGFYKINREQTVAASMKYFDLGEIQFRDVNAIDQGRFNPREYAFDVSYSRLLTENLSIGGAIRYIRSNLTGALTTGNVDAKPGSSGAVDLGVFYTKPMVKKNSLLSCGASITNLGAKISYSNADSKDFIPVNLRMGTAFKTELDPFNSLTFAMDLSKLMVPSRRAEIGQPQPTLLSGIFSSFTDAPGGFKEEAHEVIISGGMEYLYRTAFAGRLGYFLEAKDKGNRKYFTAGIGMHLDKFSLDVAYLVPTNRRDNALAETIRFTILISIKNKEKEEESVTD